jgi:perosamine synthetase
MIAPLRHIAPAGAPIHVADLVKSACLVVSPHDVQAELRADLQRRFGIRHSYLTSTGRAGMTVLLRALRRQAEPDRDEVILPTYTCYSVAASVLKAGLRPRLVDVDPATFDYQIDELEAEDFSKVLAVVACNLYGYPNDILALRRLTRRQGIFLVDDAAQAMGARSGGAWCGTGGDFGLYSFDKGKNVSAIDGGVVVTNDDKLATAYEEEQTALASPRPLRAVDQLLKAVIYSVFLRPSLYWIPNRVPQLGLGKTVFTTEFPLETPTRLLTALAGSVMPRLGELTTVRAANAAALARELRAIPGLSFVRPQADAVPAFLRLPILLPDTEARRRALSALTSAGIGASASYPLSLADLQELRPFVPESVRASGGREVARRILTLPTHTYVAARDISTIATVLSAELETVRNRRTSSAA